MTIDQVDNDHGKDNMKTCKELTLLADDHSLFKRTDRCEWFLNNAFLSEQKSDPVDEGFSRASYNNVLHLSKVGRARQRTKRVDGHLGGNSLHVLCAVSKEDEYFCDEDLFEERGELLSYISDEESTSLVLTTDTQITVLYTRYRLVLYLDISPSMAVIDQNSGMVLFESLFINLENTFRSLVHPITLAGGTMMFNPDLYVTVIAQGSFLETFKVVVQGLYLSEDSLQDALSSLKQKLDELENEVTQIYLRCSKETLTFSSTLQNMMQTAAFALKLLPQDACPNIIFFTDGVTFLPSECNGYDSILMLLNREDISCSTLLVSTSNVVPIHCTFGYIADIETLRHLSLGTSGCFISMKSVKRNNDRPNISYECESLNKSSTVTLSCSPHQKWILCKDVNPIHHSSTISPSESRLWDGEKFSLLPEEESRVQREEKSGRLGFAREMMIRDATMVNVAIAVDHPFPWSNLPPPPVPVIKSSVKRYTMAIDLLPIVRIRMSEGFQLDHTSMDNATQTRTVGLFLLWQPNVTLFYTITHREGHHCITIDFEIVAFYEFLLQYTKLVQNPGNSHPINSPARLQTFIASMIEADRMVWHLTSQVLPSLEVPENAADQISAKESVEYNSRFWKLLTSIGLSSWYKWFETDKLEMIIHPVIDHRKQWERDVNIDLQQTFTDASRELDSTLYQWATSTYEERLYMKILPCSSAGPLGQHCFVIAQMTYETINMLILHLSFYNVLPSARAAVIVELKDIINMTSDQPPDDEEDKVGRRFHLLSKPLRPLIIRYDNTNTNGTTKNKPHPSDSMMGLRFTPVPSIPASPSFHLLLSYMPNKRWIWRIPNVDTQDLVMQLIIKARLRQNFLLQSYPCSFNFIKCIYLNTSPIGIDTEHPKLLPCMIQYVIYRASDNYIITEIWMEPQYGTLLCDDPAYAMGVEDGLFETMRHWIYETDMHVIASLSTFDTLITKSKPSEEGKAKSIPMDGQEQPETPFRIQKPPFSLGSIVTCNRAVVEREYELFQTNDVRNSSLGMNKTNSRLYDLLQHTIHVLHNRQIPLPHNDADLIQLRLQECYCYEKVLHSSVLLLSFLQKPVNVILEGNFKVRYYECSRESLREPTRSKFPDAVIQSITAPLDDRQVIDQYPHRSNGSQGHSMKQRPSMSMVQFCHAIGDAHNRNFVKVLYTTLREKQNVSLVDFKRGIQSCQEYLFEVDITQYIQVINNCKQSAEEEEENQRKFVQMLAGNYQRIEGTDYYYLSSSKSTQSTHKTGAGSESENESDSLDEATDNEEENPHEYNDYEGELSEKTQKTPDLDQASDVGIYPIPIFFRMECHVSYKGSNRKKEKREFNVDTIPTPKNNSFVSETLAKGDGAKFCLHLIVVMLPPFKPISHSNTDVKVINDEKQMSVEALPLSNVRRVIRQTGTYVRQLISEQILNALRFERPVTRKTLDLVLQHMRNLTFSDSLSSFTVPLPFLDARDGRKLFSNELINCDPSVQGLSLKLNKIDDLYYLSEDRETSEPENIPYWLILSYNPNEGAGDTTRVSFHSQSIASVQRTTLFSSIRTALLKVCERVNRLILLYQLHETKICSSLLLVPEEGAPSDEKLTKNQLVNPSPFANRRGLFEPGSLACDCVGEINLPIHTRLTPQQAVRALIATALHPLFVINRPDLFVFKDTGGKIVYMKLSDTSSGSSQANGESVTLLLRLYGVDPPGVEFTEQLGRLLESKLAQHTLAYISNLLERNPLLKLTPEDVQFIRGSTLLPCLSTMSKLPHHVDMSKFFRFLRQSIGQYLSTLHTTFSGDTSHEIISTRYGALDFNENSETEGAFVYNVLNRKASSVIQQNASQGISIVRLTYANPSDNLTESSVNETSWLEMSAQDVPTHSDSWEKEMNLILIEVWTREGTSSAEALCSQLKTSIAHTVCEYIMEEYLLKRRCHVINLYQELLSPGKQVLQRAEEMNAASVFHLQLASSLPTWAIHNFVCEVQAILLDINAKMQPIACFSEDIYSDYKIYNSQEPELDLQTLLVNKDRYLFSIIGGNIDHDASDITGEFIPYPDEHLLYPHVASSDGKSLNRKNAIFIIVQSGSIEIFTYNWNSAGTDHLKSCINRLKSWTSMRSNLLTSILFQKLGLFNHTPLLTVGKLHATNSAAPPMNQGHLSMPRAGISSQQTDVARFTVENIELLVNNPSPNRAGATQEVKPQGTGRKSRRDFNTVLKGEWPIEPLHQSQMAKITDPVKLHGSQFRAVANHTSFVEDHSRSVQEILNMCTKFLPTSNVSSLVTQFPHNILNGLSDHLPMVLKSCRNLDTFRCNFMLDAVDIVDNSAYTKYYQKGLEKYLHEFTEQLEALGFQRLKMGQQNNTSWLFITQSAHHHIIQRTFIRPLRGGIVMLRLTSEERMTVCCESMSVITQKPRINTVRLDPIQIRNRENFREDYKRLMTSVSFGTSLYDYHLRTLLFFMEELSTDSPSNEVLSTASHFVSILQACRKCAETSVEGENDISYAENEFSTENSVQSEEIFHYLSENAKRYGLVSLSAVGLDAAVCQVAPNFGEEVVDPNVQYAMVAFMDYQQKEEKQKEMRVQYYLLRVNKNIRTYGGKRNRVNKMSHLMTKARDHVSTVLKRASQDYYRDHLWRSLLRSGSSPEDTHITGEQFSSLCNLVVRKRIEEIDTSLTQLMALPLYWGQLMQHLIASFPKFAVQISKDKEMHLILFNPWEPDMLIHGLIEEGNGRMFFYACRRVASDAAMDAHEAKHVTSVINQVLYFLWRTLITEK
ncbi:hypothetical protein PROFUN_08395 [Planoprotostelium fungivorum]|uniref:Protein SZT2 n=1 Tax=Planoprotostelium fungivorum TaxID=1890364 RepID=A0A2P6NJQ9_9EUKA|nr:hypothetical protein PROFUN_10647 [Planoprotostelium fungivorum]PRP84195.1 hypothetical protein PROFUN_08395 [Planoprotostelium fungivorum]